MERKNPTVQTIYFKGSTQSLSVYAEYYIGLTFCGIFNDPKPYSGQAGQIERDTNLFQLAALKKIATNLELLN